MCEGANFVGESEMLSDFLYFCHTIFAVIAQLVEHRLPKPRVTGSSPAYRSFDVVQCSFCSALFFCIARTCDTRRPFQGLGVSITSHEYSCLHEFRVPLTARGCSAGLCCSALFF